MMITIYRSLPVTFVVSTLLLFGSTANAATELAKVNGKVITLEDFSKKYQALAPLYPAKNATKQAILEDVIRREVAVQEAKRLKLDQDPAVQEELNTVLYQALLRTQLAKDLEKMQITDTDARAWYEKNPEIRTSHIFIAVPPGSSKEAETGALKRIREIQDKELKSGRSFSEIAQKFSDGAAAPQGGDIDYQSRDQLDPAYYQAALSLKTPGKVSGIVRTPFGYHLIKLTAVRPWSEVEPNSVKLVMLRDRKQDLYERYIKTLRSKAQVQVRNDLIR